MGGDEMDSRQSGNKPFKYEPRCETTGLWGFRPGPTQTRLYKHTRWIEA